MNFKGLTDRVVHFGRMIRARGLGFAARFAFWRIKTGSIKAWIGIEDRSGWFSYARWIRENEVAQPPMAKEAINPAVGDSETVRLSFLIPYGWQYLVQRWGESRSTALFLRTLRSLLAQTSFAWEACLLGDRPETFSFEMGDSSVEDVDRILWRQGVGTGAEGLSTALAQARGEWVMILYPGDTVSPGVCAELSLQAQQITRPEMIYFDQDQLAPDGFTRKNPVLWPDWSPELLLSANYLEHACFRRDGLRSCAAQSQGSAEALLRCVEQAHRIVHIPHILYHQADALIAEHLLNLRFSPSDVAAHLQRSGLTDVHVEVNPLRSTHFSWPVSGRLVSIIIPSKDHWHYLQRCLASLFRLTHYPNYEVVIVDNDSQEADTLAYYDQLKQNPKVRVLKNQTAFNYSAYNNLGARHARGDLLLFLNNDVEAIDPSWLDELVQWAEWSDIGVVGAKLLYPDGSIQHAGIVVGMEGHGSHVYMGAREGYTGLFGSVEWYRDVSAVTGACLMMRREVFEKIGGFDENYILVFNDIEICTRVLANGYRVVYNPFARLIHYEGKSRGRYIPPDDIRLGCQHLKGIVAQGDPYYNPNLSYAVRSPTLRRTWEEDRLRRLETIVQLAI